MYIYAPMKIVDQLKKPIAKEMELFEDKFSSSMRSHVALLNRITYYIVNRKGKQMRPMFVFMVAKMLEEKEVNERCYRAASVIELIHTATLVHDDVVDESYQRRGFFSINALWKNKIAVLVGDYLLSKGLLLCIDHKDFDLLEIISVAVREMSEGELLQIEKTRRLDIDESIYMEIIRQKTATLIASCCALGAASIHASAETVEQLRQFGEDIGIAFQIKDDLFDYGKTKIGKPTGIDIREKKMTLPLIHVINKSNKKQKKWLINSVRHHNKDKKRVKRIIAFVKEQGGLDYATAQMHAYKDKALAQLHGFPKNEFRDALEEMVRYVIERKK